MSAVDNPDVKLALDSRESNLKLTGCGSLPVNKHGLPTLQGANDLFSTGRGFGGASDDIQER